MGNTIGIDSQLLTYLLDAMIPSYDPLTDKGRLFPVRQAMLRIYFYTGHSFYILPTVQDEYLTISDPARRKAHERVHEIMLLDITMALDPDAIRERKEHFSTFHYGEKDQNDCQILAEAEIAGLSTFLTIDGDFYNHLHTKTESVNLLYPGEFWESLNIPKGMQPTIIPDSTNPLHRKDWWKW